MNECSEHRGLAREEESLGAGRDCQEDTRAKHKKKEAGNKERHLYYI
jgi:hypothetical protein